MDFRNDDEIVATFVEETQGHLAAIEYGILKLENDREIPDDELVHDMFRAMHSIKAGANLLEYRNIEVLSHELESFLDLLRLGKLVLDGEHNETINVFLEGIDKIGELVDNLRHSDDTDISLIAQKLVTINRSEK
ncbi:MAG: chemotaxis protein CheA [Proteobacteria bacterium]|nr:chemotaxis protein CheA [Pseudomonadota bacterium]